MSYTVGQLHKYSVDLYKRLPAETGQEVGFHVTGNLRLATCRDRMDEYLKYCGTANTIGVPFQIISPAEVKALWPLVNLGDGVDTPKIVGALYHPDDGHIAPVDLTMALRRGARTAGAEICEQTEVLGVERTASGEWKIATNQGDIVCEHVVCATGNYARETGRKFGLDVPSIPVEHQYIVYDESPELKAYRAARRPRARGVARVRRLVLPARGAHGLDPRPVREGRTGAIRRRRPRAFRQGVVPGRPRPPAAARRGGDEARAVPRARRHQDDRQRSHRLHAGRQPAGRSGVGLAQCLAERRPQLWRHGRRRRGMAARGVDRRGRARHRHAGRRPTPVRRVHRQALHRPQERGDLSQRLHDPLPRRGARGCAPRQDQRRLRKAEPDGRRLGAALRLGARELVRAAGRAAQGRVELPAQQLFPARRRRVPADARGGGRDRPHAVHEARGDRPRRRRLARLAGREQGPGQAGPHRAVPRADEERRDTLRVHDHETRRGSLLRRQRGRGRALRQRLSAPDAAGRPERRVCAMSPRAAARSSSPAPTRARCWRN